MKYSGAFFIKDLSDLVSMINSTAFEAFYRSAYPRLYATAAQILGDEESARDIVSDAFEYAWNHFDQIPEDRMLPYLISHVRSRSIDHLRRQQTHDSYIEFVQTITSEIDDNESGIREARVKEVHRVLNLLTPRTRTIFIECYVKHKKYAEVADQLGISAVAVKKAIMQALDTFRRECRIF